MDGFTQLAGTCLPVQAVSFKRSEGTVERFFLNTLAMEIVRGAQAGTGFSRQGNSAFSLGKRSTPAGALRSVFLSGTHVPLDCNVGSLHGGFLRTTALVWV